MNNEQFTRYWTKAQPIVAGYVNALVRDFHEAEDLVQDVAVILLRKSGDYDVTRPFEAWALGIAKRRILSLRRAHARSRIVFNQETIDTVAARYSEMASELNERAAALRECIKRVRGRNREVVNLWYEGAMKPRQIAERLEVPGGTIRAILTRVRKELRQCINRKLATRGLAS